MSKKYANPIDFIFPLNINGLEGRFLYLGSTSRNKKSNILVVYDLNSNIEKWWGLAIALNKYANITIVDLPGIGGMDSLYKIYRKPSIDNLADYLSSFIKLRFKRKKLNIFAVGLGSAIVTRMLQNDKSAENKILNLIAINGYSHHDDFNLSIKQKRYKIFLYNFLSLRFIAFIIETLFFNKKVLEYRVNEKIINKIKSNLPYELVRTFLIDLLYENDCRTHFFLKREILKLDNCQTQLSIPFYQISSGFKQNNLLPNRLEQHLKITFKNYNYLPLKELRKIPFILNDPKLAIKLIPPKIRNLLKKS